MIDYLIPLIPVIPVFGALVFSSIASAGFIYILTMGGGPTDEDRYE